MAIGQKTRRYLLARKDPTAALMQRMGEMDGMVKKAAGDEAGRVVSRLAAGAAASIAMIKMETSRKFQILLADLEKQIPVELKKKIDSLPQIKGEPGYTPVKGKDYFDGKPGNPGAPAKTLIPGKDYPTVEMMDKYLGASITALYQKLEGEGMTKKQIRLEIADMFKNINGENVARALEALSGTKKLSYTALKDTPSEPVAGHQHTLHRGGGSGVAGSQTYSYDLSSLCDGVTKSFAVPVNTRIVLVQSTDAPSGILRKTTDWTGSGTTTLLLTAGVSAPSFGATLQILYVV